MAPAGILPRIGHLLLSERRGLASITAIYVAAGFGLLHYDCALNNEGLVVHYFATWAGLDLPAVFFLQRAKPVLVALYAIPSQAGVLGTMAAHVLVSASALPLLAGFARTLGYQYPNLPALVVAFSPIFFLGGAAGIANNDAVVGTALVLALLGRGHALASGIVLGCLPWVRAEIVPFVAILGLHGLLVERNYRFIAGIGMFPVAYALSGAVYHRDLLWLLHYPPAAAFDPGNPMFAGQRIGPEYFLGFMPAVTPLMGLAVGVSWARLLPIERTLFFYLLLMTTVLEVFPIFRIGNFGGSPRYLAQLLPVLGLLAARVLELPDQRSGLRVLQGAAALGITLWAVTRMPDAVHVVPVVALFATMVAFICLRWKGAATLVAAVLALAGPALVPGTQLARKDLAAYIDPMEEWLYQHRDSLRGAIYTNAQLLDAFAQRRGRLPPLDVKFLIGFDQVEGTVDLGNPYNGQRDAIRRLCARSLYGHGVIASELRPDDVAPGALFALRVDRRLDITLPPAIWADRLEILHEEGNARIARLRPPPASAAR